MELGGIRPQALPITKDIDFPANREDLVRHARGNDAGEDVLDVLKRMDNRRYESMADVMKGLGNVV